MSWKRTILAGVIFGLVLFLVWTDRRIAEKAVYQSVVEQSLAPGVNKSEVIEVTLRNQSGEAKLVREGGQWRMKSPVSALADPETVDQLLTNVTGARKRNETEVKNLAEYGLATPLVELSMKTDSGKTFGMLLGNESTYTGQVFAKYQSGQTVFTVGQQVKSVLQRPALDFRRSRLLDVDVANLAGYKAISIVRPSGEVLIEQDAGRWRITKPVETPAEPTIVEDYLKKAGILRASSYITETTDKPTSMAVALEALTSPSLTVTLVRVRGADVKVDIGNAGDDANPIYVGRRGSDAELMLLRPESVRELGQDENYFWSRTLFATKPNEVGMLSVELGRLRFDLLRNDKDRWEFVGDPGRRVDQEGVNVRLESLLKARIREFVDVAPRDLETYGLRPPRIRFTLQTRDKSRSESLETGRQEAQGSTAVYARRRGDPSVFTIDLSSELVFSPDALADRKFARAEMDQVSGVEIAIGDATYKLRKEGAEWQLRRPGNNTFAPVDAVKLGRVFDALNTLQYEKDLSSGGDTVIVPGDQASLTLKLLDTDGKDLVQLAVGRKLKNSCFVRALGDRVYEVSIGEINRLEAAVQSLIQ